jgi:hypothetical protein
MLLKRQSVLIEVRFLNSVSKSPSNVLDDSARQKEHWDWPGLFFSSDPRLAGRAHQTKLAASCE